jgi:hypothetical protein
MFLDLIKADRWPTVTTFRKVRVSGLRKTHIIIYKSHKGIFPTHQIPGPGTGAKEGVKALNAMYTLLDGLLTGLHS